MANATTRAHVRGSQPTAADPCRKSSDEAVQTSETPPIASATQTISHKERRKQKKQRISLEPFAEIISTDIAHRPRAAPNNPPCKKQREPQPSTDTHLFIPSMPAARNAAQKGYSLLVCSLGNPGLKYAHTLHSAGHTVTAHIAQVKNFQPFRKELSGMVSRPNNTVYSFGILRGYTREKATGPPADGDDWIFWHSTSMMNVSGVNVKKAWREWSRDMQKEGYEPRLVVVHDELESPLGKVTIKDGTASARGHNGLKSCQSSLGNMQWWRIGVGIGRPDSREPDVVAKYVLRKMTRTEMGAMIDASSDVVDALRQISEGRK